MLDTALRLGFDDYNEDVREVLNLYKEVKNNFYRYFDPSLISAFITAQSSDVRHHLQDTVLLGEGNHFRVYKIRLDSDVNVAVSCAKPKFLKEFSHQKNKWVDMMGTVKKIDHVLIPPMELFETENDLAYIQPCCDSGKYLFEDRVLSKLSRSLDRALYERQMGLIDGQQIMEYKGLAFVVDWSDLSFL